MKKPLIHICVLLFAGLPLFAGSWDRIETEFTTIIFEERDVQYAQDIASFADDVLLELATLLDHKPDRKVPVILSGRPSVSNGMYSPFPSSIILYLTSPIDRFLGSRSASWLRSLYTHELTHYLHLTSPVGPAKKLIFLGPEIPAMNTAVMPLWWVEGIATYTESEYAQGGRGDSPLFALTWQSPMLEDRLWSLSQGRYNSAFPPSGRVYSTGYLMVDYLMRHYGRDSFVRVNTSYTWFPFFGLNRALKMETGFSSKELFALAIDEQELSLPQGISLGEVFSPDTFGDYYLPNSTELGLVGYSRTHDSAGALVRYSPEGDVEKIKSLIRVDDDSIAIKATKALFSFVWADPYHHSSLPLAPASYSDLMLYDFSLDSFTRITNKAMLSHPDLSSDGKLLVAIERRGDRYSLVSIDEKTAMTKTLYDNPNGSVFEPVIAEDNTVIVVEIVGGNSSLLAIGVDGSRSVLVPPTKSEIRSPVLSDESLLFVSDDAGYMSLYRYDFESGKVEKLLTDPQGILHARFEQESLLYETYRSKGIALKRIPTTVLDPVHVVLQGPLPPDRISLSDEARAFISKPFRDYPRINLVLPFPFVTENKVHPGLWLHSQSVLKRQKLIAQVGWDIGNVRLVGAVDYLYNPGPYSLGLQGSFDKESRASLSLSLPLLYQASLYNFKLLSLSSSLGFVSQDGDVLPYVSALLGYQIQARPRSKDFFGAPYAFTSVGVQSFWMDSPVPDQYRIFGTLAGQLRMFCSSQMLAVQVDAANDSKADLDTALLYEGFSDRGLDAEAKARLSLRYHIPFGLLDQPIPYGGLTGLGLTLSAQSAYYYNNDALLWDEEVVVSARLTSSMVVGGGLVIRPFVTLAYRSSDGKGSFSIGLNGGSLLVSQDGSSL